MKPIQPAVPGLFKTGKRLVAAPLRVLYEQRRMVRPILTQMYLVLGHDHISYIIAWWKYLTDKILSGQPRQDLVRLWKSYCLDTRNRLLKKEGYVPVDRPEWPHPPEGSWLTQPEQLSRNELLRRVSILVASRSMPAGDKQTEIAALEKTLRTLTTYRPPLTGEERRLISFYSRIAGEEVGICASRSKVWYRLDAHASLTNRSCYEVSGKDGGKFNFFLDLFYREYLLEVPLADEDIISPLGVVYHFPAGQPRWTCDIGNLPPAEGKTLGESLPQSGWLFPKKAGLSENRIGSLLWFFCYQHLVKEEYITVRGLSRRKPFPARLCSVGEPGGKVRIPTVSLACLIGYLQPYQHLMKGVLETDPTLHAGLGSAYQAYELAKRLEGRLMAAEGLLLGDLEDATNWVSHEVGELHLDSFTEGLARGRPVTDYIAHAGKLVLTPLLIEYDEEVWLTCNGAPMGLPGTKILLHSLGKAVEKRAERQDRALPYSVQRLSSYSNAGDDIAKFGPKVILRRHREACLEYKLKPSDDKWGIYEVGGPFCEVMLSLGGKATPKPETVIAPEYPMLVEPPRARLLSPETKPRTSDDDTNPSFGKGKALGKEQTWVLDQRVSLHSSLLFIRNFREYGDQRQLAALPKLLGGYGLKLSITTKYSWLGESLRKICNLVVKTDVKSPRYPEVVSAIRRLTAPLLYDRGDPLDEWEENPLVELFRDYAVETDSLLAFHEVKFHTPYPRYWDKVTEIRKRNYIPLTDLARPKTPFWERPPPQRGWGTAPFSLRLKRVEKKLGKLLDDVKEVSLEDFEELSSRKPYYTNTLWLKGDMRILGDNELTPLNIRAQSFGLSMRFGLPNKDAVFGRDADLPP